MAFLQQPNRHYGSQTPNMTNRPSPRFNSTEQRMLIILFAVFFTIVLLVGMLVRELTVRVAQEGADLLGLNESAEMSLGAAPLPAGSGIISPVFTPEVRHWEPQIARWAQQHNLDPNMVAIIMQIESCGDPRAQSGAGARGLFQVMPFHFTAGEDSFDPDTNAFRGMNYFSERLVQTNGDLGKAFAGYNGGHVAAGGEYEDWYPETQRYFVWSTGIWSDIQSGMTVSPTVQQWLQAGGASLCQQAATRLGIN